MSTLIRLVAAAVFLVLPVSAEIQSMAKALSEKNVAFTETSFGGFQQFNFKLPGGTSPCIIVVPKAAADGNPWVWRARFWGHQPDFDQAMLAKGYHLCFCDVANLYGGPVAVDRWNQFYDFSRSLDLGAKPVLEGMSRGGLIIFNWAKANPEKVTAIYGDNPVCDIRSWPAKKSPADWQRCLEAYHITLEQVAAFKGNPIDGLEPLAKAKVPVFLVLGAKDDVVPLVENANILEERYKTLGGSVTRWVKPNDNHHPHGLKPVQPLVNAILNAAEGK